MTIKEQIADCVSKNRRFSVTADQYTFLDALVYDISDPDAVRLLCKFNTSPMTTVDPEMGNKQTLTGLQEIIIPYDKINFITCLDVSEDLMNKYKERFPQDYERRMKLNHVEGVSWDNQIITEGTGYKKPPVDPAVKVSEEGVVL